MYICKNIPQKTTGGSWQGRFSARAAGKKIGIVIMIGNTASLDLVEFIETSILPAYADFDKAHGLAHVNRVIKRSLELASSVGANIDMAYVVAAYHDIGMSGPRPSTISPAARYWRATCGSGGGSRPSR